MRRIILITILWLLLPIALFAQINQDVGVISIDIPDVLPPDTTLNPHATVANFGTNTETFDVTCEILPQIAPEAYFSTIRVADLAPGDSMQVTFLPDFTFVFGAYPVKVYTQLIGDGNPVNDTLEKVIVVQATDIAEGNSDKPEPFMFRTPTISRNEAQIELVISQATKVDILVYDALGRLCKTLTPNRFSAGTHSLRANFNLPSGIYFYNLKTEWGENITKKFVIVE
jgi:hypothetical protein